MALGTAARLSLAAARAAWRSRRGVVARAAQGARLVLTGRVSVSIPEEAEDPACIPIFWVSKWVDYSDKYGLGRSLPGGQVAQAWPREPLARAPSTLLSPAQAPQGPPLPARFLRFLSAARVPAV